MDIIFHTAAVVTDWAPKKLFWDVTVGGAENICRAAVDAKVCRLVDISTCDVFGTDESKVMDESMPLQYWGEPYADSKIDAEKIMRKYHEEHGLPLTMVYPLWVYGEGDQTFVPLLADAIIKREALFWRKGAIVWPTYIDNLIDLLMLISEDERAIGNGYLVHDGESTTLEEFCSGIAEASRCAAHQNPHPLLVSHGCRQSDGIPMEAFSHPDASFTHYLYCYKPWFEIQILH